MIRAIPGVKARNKLYHAWIYLKRSNGDDSAIGIIGYELHKLEFVFRKHFSRCKRCIEIRSATPYISEKFHPPQKL